MVDLTQGSIISRLLLFAAPILIGQLLQTLYNSVDSVIVGNYLGTNALAAVTASSTIANFLVGFFVGLSTGASVLFGRYFGARDYERLRVSIHTSVLFSLLLGGAVAALFIVFTPQLLVMVSCPADVFGDASVYLRIYLVGVLFLSLYNICAAAIRSTGDSRAPFYYLLVSSSLHIGVAVVLVVLMDMGVVGVAVATVVSQFISVALCIARMMGSDERYRFRWGRLALDRKTLGQIAVLGLPAGLQASISSLSTLYLQQYINTFSPAAIAGVGSSMKVDQFAGMPCQALGLAMTTFISQNMGAGKADRARRGVRVSCVAVVLIVAVTSVPLYVFAPNVIGIFGSDPEMIAYGAGLLHVIMPIYLVMGLIHLFGGITRGYGWSISTMAISVGGMVVLRQLFLAVALESNYSIETIYMGYPVGWIATLAPLLMLYFHIVHKVRREPSFRALNVGVPR